VCGCLQVKFVPKRGKNHSLCENDIFWLKKGESLSSAGAGKREEEKVTEYPAKKSRLDEHHRSTSCSLNNKGGD